MEAFELLKTLYYKLNPNISEDLWIAIKDAHKLEKFSKKQEILKVGEICDFVSLVTKGLFRMYHVSDGEEVIYEFYPEMSLLSDYSSFVQRVPSNCIIQALEESELLSINYKDLESIYKKFPEMYQTVTTSLDVLYVGNTDKYYSILMDGIETRYLNFLQKRPELANRIPQYMIASYIGVSPETLTRMRRSLGM